MRVEPEEEKLLKNFENVEERRRSIELESKNTRKKVEKSTRNMKNNFF